MKKTALLKLSVFIIITIITVGCFNGGSDDNGNYREDNIIQEITYYFGDSSVPPEFHRSYSITVMNNIVSVVVDSYGDILADEEYEITNEQFNNIRNSLLRNDIRNCELGPDDDCAGGTSESVSYSDGEVELFSESVYHCGGEDTGNLCGDVTNFANDVKSLVPNLEDFLQ